MSKEYVNYHKHCHYSNLAGTADSTAKPIDYVKRAKELGHSVVSCVQHGNPYGFFEYYDLCKQHGMKFLFGVEAYMSLKIGNEDQINSHLCILAMNQNGMRTINSLTSRANKENFYYKPRILLDWLLELDNPQDIFITTACVGGIIRRENYEEIIYKLYSKYKNNIMVEIQYHMTQLQKDMNNRALYLNKKYGINLIVGCDSHMINESEKIDRDALLYAKGISYPDEEGWYLDYPSYDEIVDRFDKQGVLTIKQVEMAIGNTLILKNTDEIYIDKNIKIPSMYPNKTQEEKDKILFEIIKNELENKFGSMKDVPKPYRDAVIEELRVIKDTKFSDYFILNYHIIKRGVELGGHITTTGRGSAPSFYINSLLGFSTIDRLDSPVTLYPERFATVDRILAGSMFDIDFNVSDRKPFMQAQSEILGEDNSYWFSAYGKLKTKSAWKMYAKSNDVPFETSNAITKFIDDYETALKYAEDEEKENIKVENYIPTEYIDIFNKSKKYFGIIDSISIHPCAFLLLNNPISCEIGIIKVKDEFCANIEGSYADKYMYMKNDLLGVTVVDIISKTFERIGKKTITASELIKITKNDKKTWDIYKNGYTMCLNQVEQQNTRTKVMKYSPVNISELSAFVAGIRPSFQSMIDIFLNREHFRYGIEEFDNLLMTDELPESFILYQESTMKVLGYAGFPMSETYQLIKAIAKKKTGIIEPIKDRFIKGFKDKAQCDDESVLKVWQIVEDNVGYGFNASHALSVAIDSLYGAYLKAYYPLEFYTTCIDIYTKKKNKKKLSAIKEEMRTFGIFEGELKFGENNSEITFDKNKNKITQLLGSIKDINEKCSIGLYELSKTKKYSNFLELLIDIKERKILQSNQLSILIHLDYFSDFGKSKYLLDIVEIYDKFYDIKQIKKDKLDELGLSDTFMDKISTKSTAKLYKDFNYMDIIDYKISNLENRDISIKDKLKYELEYLGYIQYKNDNLPKNLFYVLETKFYGNSKTKPYLKMYNILTSKTFDMKIVKDFEFNSFDVGDVIIIESVKKENKKKKVDGKYITIPNQFNLVIDKWKIIA